MDRVRTASLAWFAAGPGKLARGGKVKSFIFLMVVAMYLSSAGLFVYGGHWIVGALLGFLIFSGVSVKG
jgi:hypothetical protein